MKLRLTYIISGLFLSSLPAFGQQGITPALENLATMLCGSYSNDAQSRSDTTFFDIRLRISWIWRFRADGVWLYFEQSLASMQTKPFRQRIYRLTQKNDSTFESAYFTLRQPLRFAGEWRRENLLKTQSPDSVFEAKGCAFIMQRNRDGTYTGWNPGANCPNDSRGAVYTTTLIMLSHDKLLIWDRGYNAIGKQMWGSIKGGYEFIKKTE